MDKQDARLRRALLDAALADYQAVQSDSPPVRTRTRKPWWYWPQHVACVLLSLAFLGGTLLDTSAAAREAAWKWLDKYQQTQDSSSTD